MRFFNCDTAASCAVGVLAGYGFALHLFEGNSPTITGLRIAIGMLGGLLNMSNSYRIAQLEERISNQVENNDNELNEVVIDNPFVPQLRN